MPLTNLIGETVTARHCGRTIEGELVDVDQRHEDHRFQPEVCIQLESGVTWRVPPLAIDV